MRRPLTVFALILLLAPLINGEDNTNLLSRWTFTTAAGWGTYEVDNSPIRTFIELEKGGYQWFAEASYRFSPRFSIVGGLTRTTRDLPYTGVDHTYARMWSPYTGLQYDILSGSVNLSMFGGIAYCFGVLQTPAQDQTPLIPVITPQGAPAREYTGADIGFWASGGFTWMFRPELGLSLRSGYRFADIDVRSNDHYSGNIDFSGPFAMVGLTYHPQNVPAPEGQSSLSRKWKFTAAGGWGAFDKDDPYEGVEASYLGMQYRQFSDGPQALGQVSFDLSPRIALTAGIVYINADRSEVWVRPYVDSPVYRENLAVHAWYPYIGAQHAILLGPISLSAGGGLGSCVTAVHIESGTSWLYEMQLSAANVGYQLSTDLSWHVSNHTAVTLLSGYRFVERSILHYENSLSRLIINLSGPYAMIGLTFRP